MSELKGMDFLRRRLAQKRSRVLTRYKYYEMKNAAKDLGISTPDSLKWLTATLGWCAKGVDSLADRLVFREFREDNLGMMEIFIANNMDIFPDSAILAALISSCSFVYISQDEEDDVRLQVIDGANATGEIDPITNLLTEGYAVLKRDSENEETALIEAYFTPSETVIYELGKKPYSIKHGAGVPLLVPIINRPDAVRRFGRSRISRSCMYLQESACRTLVRSEITSEFYSFPQKYVTGLSQDAEGIDKWKAAISMMMTFTKDNEGNHPIVGQFSQGSVTPHIEQYKMAAAAFCGETGLTLDDLGFPQNNPSSADAIKAAHENLRLTARRAQRAFGTGFLNVGYTARCLRDEYHYKRAIVFETKPIFEPAFEPDASMLGGIGDAVLKLNQAMPNYVNEEKMKDMTGF